MDLNSALSLKLDTSYLIVSMLWSAVGGGFWLYGKKQRSGPALFGGVGLIAISWLITSWFWMSVAAVVIIAGIWWWARHND